MKKTLKSLFETGVLHLAVLCLIFALALVVSGCSVTKVNYEKDEKGAAEWILVYGLLFDKEEEAKTILENTLKELD